MKMLELKDVGYYYDTYSNCGQDDIGSFATHAEFFLRPSRLLAPLAIEDVNDYTIRERLADVVKQMFGIDEDD